MSAQQPCSAPLLVEPSGPERVPLLLCHLRPLPGGQEGVQGSAPGGHPNQLRAGGGGRGPAGGLLPGAAGVGGAGPLGGGLWPQPAADAALLVHGATCDGAAANPTVSLQELLLAQASLPGTLLTLAAQGPGVQAACTLSRLHWAWELSDLHVLQSLMDVHCSSALRTSAPTARGGRRLSVPSSST
ncbi:hypothetical protein GH733_008270 [Mirounga leonina]|nr:hypothetical protein GH733_008270 [Mirounga leonina]